MDCQIGCCQKNSIIDKALKHVFQKLGVFIGQHPGYFVIVPVLLTLLCMTGYQQINYEIDPEYLFSPINGLGKDERALIEQHFKVNYTHRFDVGRITRPGRFGRVIITSKDADPNLIRREVFEELRMLDGIIQNTTVLFDGVVYTYDDICARWNEECFSNDILNLDQIMDDILSGEVNLTFPAMFNPVTFDVHLFPVFFGGTKLSADRNVVSVPSMQMVYFATVDTPRQDARAAMWEEAFLINVGVAEDTDRFKHISVSRFASRTLDHELERNTQSVVPYYAETFILMAILSVITCMMLDQVRSKPWMGLFGNVSAIMATCAAFGLAMYLGIPFIGINLAAPFLMIGVGIDDTFLMLAEWRKTLPTEPVAVRMGKMMSHSAVSITNSSVTTLVSFIFGMNIPIRAVCIFSQYSALAVLFTLVWHITFFAGCMAISGYAEQRNMHSLGFRVQPLSVAIKAKRSWLYRTFISGGINRDDPDNPIDNQENSLMNFFRTYVAAFVNNSWGKTLILLVFIGYWAGAGYGLTQITEGLERRKLAQENSYSVKFFDLEDEYYREFPYRIQVLITGDMNYSDPQTQQVIEQLTGRLENTSYVTSSLYSESWLRTFLSFVEENNHFLNVSIDTEAGFIAALREHWLFADNSFSLDIEFNEDYTKILASRFLIQAVNISDTNHEKQMVKDLRRICTEAPINVTVFHPYFVFFDQFELVRPIAIQSMWLGAVIMFIITYFFIQNILCALCVAFCVVSIGVGVAGYMALWDVNLDPISMINLIMCIGFSVDYTAHICIAYMSSKGPRPSNRVRDALFSLGMPIVQGASTTILGCIGLLLARSYIFLVFFKMIFLVIFLSAMHGLFLMMVLLSLFGPGSWTSEKQFAEEEEKEQQMKDAEKMYPYYIPHPQLAMTGGPFNGKSFLGAPYKAYGSALEDKDLGIGTSGEGSSESSSSKSQRMKALEDETIRGRYEEGWRRSSSHNLQAMETGPSQFQPVIDLYGEDAKHMWTGRNYNYDDSYVPQPRQSAYEREDARRKHSMERRPNRVADDQHQYADNSDPRYYGGDEGRRYSDEMQRKISDERRPRKYSPPEGIYRPNPNRTASQHNLYYPRQPQRSASYHSIHQLRHTGDIRFP